MGIREIIFFEKYLLNLKFKILLKYFENILISFFWNLVKCKISKSEVKFIGKVFEIYIIFVYIFGGGGW